MNVNDSSQRGMKLPPGWRQVQLGHVSNVGTGSADLQDANPDGLYPFFVRSEDVVKIDHFTHETEAVLTAGDGNVGDIFHHVKHRFAAHQRVYVIEPDRQLTGRYLYYVMGALFKESLKGNTAKSTVESLRRPMLTSFRIPLPPIADQKIITDFLDQETAEIDEFISDFLILKNLVAEQSSVHISQTFERISQQYGDQRQKLAWNAKIVSGRPVPDSSVHVSYNKSVPVYGGNGLVGFTTRPMVHVKSVVIGRVGALCGNVHLSPPRVWITDNALLVKMTSDIYLPSYMALALEHENLNDRADRTAQPLITGGMVGSLRLPAPPRSEQLAVVSRIRSYQENATGLMYEIDEAIELARERRAALISAAVTGQIDATQKRRPVAEILEDEVGVRV